MVFWVADYEFAIIFAKLICLNILFKKLLQKMKIFKKCLQNRNLREKIREEHV